MKLAKDLALVKPGLRPSTISLVPHASFLLSNCLVHKKEEKVTAGGFQIFLGMTWFSQVVARYASSYCHVVVQSVSLFLSICLSDVLV